MANLLVFFLDVNDIKFFLYCVFLEPGFYLVSQIKDIGGAPAIGANGFIKNATVIKLIGYLINYSAFIVIALGFISFIEFWGEKNSMRSCVIKVFATAKYIVTIILFLLNVLYLVDLIINQKTAIKTILNTIISSVVYYILLIYNFYLGITLNKIVSKQNSITSN